MDCLIQCLGIGICAAAATFSFCGFAALALSVCACIWRLIKKIRGEDDED